MANVTQIRNEIKYRAASNWIGAVQMCNDTETCLILIKLNTVQIGNGMVNTSGIGLDAIVNAAQIFNGMALLQVGLNSHSERSADVQRTG